MHGMAVLSYLAKLKRSLGLAFGAYYEKGFLDEIKNIFHSFLSAII